MTPFNQPFQDQMFKNAGFSSLLQRAGRLRTGGLRGGNIYRGSRAVCCVVCFLQKHLQWVLHVTLEGLQELSGNGTVNSAVVRAQGDSHDRGSADITILTGNDTLLSGTNGQDAGLGRVNDGSEVLDTVHAHVGDGEGTALVLVGGELVGAGTGSEVLDLVRDSGQTLGLGAGDNGGDQTRRSRGGDADIGAVVLSDRVVHPRAVGLGNGLEGKGGSLDNEVVDRELVLVLGLLVEDLAELQDLVHLHLDGNVVVRDVLLGLGQTLSNDLAHVGERDVGVGSGGSGGGGGSLGGRGRGLLGYLRMIIKKINVSHAILSSV